MQKFYSFIVCFALAFLCTVSNSSGQLVINESFNGTTFPPLGWSTNYSGTSSDAENYCERVTVSSNPAGTPPGTHSGAGMARYRCGYMTQAGEIAYIASRALDFTNMPVGGTTATFWMYRDAVNTGFLDSVSVYLNDSNLIAFDAGNANVGDVQRLAIQQVAPFGFGNTVPRWWNANPTCGAAGWYQYQVTIPNNAFTVASQRYLIFVFTNRHTLANGGNIYIDDISINTYPKAQSFVSTRMSFQGTSSVPPGTTDNLIYGVEVVIDGGDDVTANNYYTIDSLHFSYIGSTNACGDAQNAKLWWTGGTDVFNGIANAIQVGATVPTLCATNYSFIPIATFRLNNGKNYFWVTYDIKPAGVSTPGNCVDGEYNFIRLRKGASAVNYTPNPATLGGCRPIDVAYCGGATPSYSTGTSWLGGSYTNNDYVAQVSLNGESGYPVINNALNCCGPNIAPWWGGPAPFSAHPPDYEKFAAVPGKTTVLMANGMTSDTINLKVGTYCCLNYIAAFIDFNHDGDFYDAGEKIAQSPAMSANGTYSVAFTVPVSAYIGTTTLRVREVYGSTQGNNIDPCASAFFGETEDYSITIIPSCNSWPGLGYGKLWLGGV
ncbi:MAG TPA: GEVED domain-containing protein, partial [Bacteroidia bacterium]|nr:GEVED domain-containing protein [Bacteroidia bacterium]